MSDNSVSFTPEQKASIEYDCPGGSLLVSAAAGSGKTMVLVERLLRHIDEGADITEFLVITYTRAAALELREKIYEELLKRTTKSHGNIRLRRQALLCRGASIDTIHTICGEILRENVNPDRLPPDFRIADGSESEMIMSEVADSVISNIYEKIEENPGFPELLDTIAEGRDDKHLVEVLINVYNKLRSTPNLRLWIKNKREALDMSEIIDMSETDYGKYILNRIYVKADYWKNEMQALREEMKLHSEFEEKYAESVDEIIEKINAFSEALCIGWDEAFRNSSFEFTPAKRVKGYEELKAIRKKCIEELRKCTAELECSSAEHIKDIKRLSVAITAFYDVILKYDDAYSEEKRRRGVADFSDLEHLTLSLLVDETTGEKTILAKNISERYKEILIDEYQDVNEVQELIFRAISKNEENIFMVGDVKQSIYRFRLADPSIFLSKYKDYSEYSQELPEKEVNNGVKIHLSKNFRSKAWILDAANYIFGNIMSVEFGELDYTEKEWLVPGRVDYIEKKGKQGIQGIGFSNNAHDSVLSTNIIDMSSLETDEDEENPASIKLEAEFVAAEIEKLTDGSHYIPDDNGGERKIECSDIVILLRSIKGKAWQFASALLKRGILTDLPGGEGYFETIEISAALAILSVIDNPLQDIPLAAVLSGPVYGFSSNELAEIRLKSRGEDFYNALKQSAEQNTESCEMSCKCTRVLDDINSHRKIAADMPADRFIWHVYNKTGLLGLVGAMRGGEKRRNNLILLAENARRFEQSGYKGLFGFLTYIRYLQDKGEELSAGIDMKASSSNIPGAVRIMSIHKSKGLEFPVVFLSNTAKRHNFADVRKSVVFDANLGVGTMITDKKRRIKYTTIIRTAIQNKLTDEMLSEELRVLYVAMTRAREKLIITAAIKDAQRFCEKLTVNRNGKTAPQALKSMNSAIEWIAAGVGGIENEKYPINIIPADLDWLNLEKNAFIADKKPVSESDNEDLTFDSEFIYPYQTAVKLPSKLTVTGIASMLDSDSEKASWTFARKENKRLYPSPDFISEKKERSAAEKGTILHYVMQHIDYNKGSYDNDIANELRRMEESEILTSEQVAEINITKIKSLFNSALGSRMIKGKNIKREFKFSILSPASKYFPDGGDDKVLIQGVVDCVFEEEDELVIVDFKTDRITESTIKERAQRYAPQLDTYADALARITGKLVKERIIYFFSLDTAINV